MNIDIKQRRERYRKQKEQLAAKIEWDETWLRVAFEEELLLRYPDLKFDWSKPDVGYHTVLHVDIWLNDYVAGITFGANDLEADHAQFVINYFVREITRLLTEVGFPIPEKGEY